MHRIQSTFTLRQAWWKTTIRYIIAKIVMRFITLYTPNSFTYLQLSFHIFEFLLLVAVEWRRFRDHVRRKTWACFPRWLNYLYFIVFQFFTLRLLHRCFDQLLLVTFVRYLSDQVTVLIRTHVGYSVIIVLCLLLFLEDLVAWYYSWLLQLGSLILYLALAHSLLLALTTT